MTRCAIYIRVSTEMQAKQQSSTLDSQTKYCKKFLSLHPDWELTDVYREEGVSGTTLNRPQFQRLLNDVRQKKFDLLLVNDIDRLGRNLKDFLNVWQIFDENQVKFISINQNLDTTSIMGKALIQLLMVFAELESNMTKQRTTQKRRYDVVEKGRWIGGRVPVGYDYDKKTKLLSINQKDADFVRLVFKLYLQRQSMWKVVDTLNIQGYRTKPFTTKDQPKGNLPINQNYINRILKSKLYAGFVPYKETWHQGTHPAIISEEIYNKSQALLSHNRSTRKSEKRTHKYLFDGKVRCAKCDYSMTPSSSIGRKGKSYKYYVCLSKFKAPKQHQCDNTQIPASILEQVVDWSLKRIYKDRKILNAKIEHYNHQINKDNSELLEQAEVLRKEEARMRNEYDSLYRVLAEKKLRNYQKIDERLKILQTAETELKQKLEDLEIRIEKNNKALFNGEGLKYYLKYYAEHEPALKFEAKRNLVRILIDRIEFKNGEIKLRLTDVEALGGEKNRGKDEPLCGFLSYPDMGGDRCTTLNGEKAVSFTVKFALKFQTQASNGGVLLKGKAIDPDSLELVDDVPETDVLRFPKTQIS
jgi:DNA invertase Pin-like site-specific DNA recombinase